VPERGTQPSAADPSAPGSGAAETSVPRDPSAPESGVAETSAPRDLSAPESGVAETSAPRDQAARPPAEDPGEVTARIADAMRDAGPVLGIDAGGTGTRAALVAGGVITRRYSSGPFNFLLSGDGIPRMAALAKMASPSAVGIGVPGIAREPRGEAEFAAAVSEACGVPARVASDATIAWLGAFLGGPGIIVMAGTGSVALGGTAGALHRVGGHGHLVGDDGGGYWLGREALRAALAAAEGTGPPTRLGDGIAAQAGASLDELVLRVQRSPADRTVLAGLAPVVARCADDPVAADIVARAAAALAGMAAALRQRLGPLPVAGAGGVFAIRPLRAAFWSATAAVEPLAPPEIGAALLAAGWQA